MYALFPDCGRRFVGVRCAGILWLGLALGAAPGASAAKPVWRPVAPEELTEAKPKLEPEAAAEVLFWNIEVDDHDFPFERTVKEYIR